MRCYWRDNDLMKWSYYEKHFDVSSSGEAGLSAGCEIGRMSVGSPTVLIDSLYIMPNSVPRSGWPEMEKPDDR